jgi:hypothetical protein
LEESVRIYYQPRRPHLKIAGAEQKEPLKKESAAKNVVSMGIAPRKTEITLKIDDNLYGELEKMARNKGLGTAEELIREKVKMYTDIVYDMNQPTQLSLWFVEQILGPQPRVKLVK